VSALRRTAVVCACAYSLSSSPSFALDPRQPLAQLHHTSWTAREGIPGAVQKIAQTADGHLWIGTTDGLFRFDGVTFERYEPEIGSLHAIAVSTLMAVPDGGLWVGYAQGGASFIKNGRVVNYDERDGLPVSTLRAFALDQSGTIWAAAVGGVVRLEEKRWRKVHTAWDYSCLSAWALFTDSRGTLWIAGASPNKVLFLPKGATKFRDTGIHVVVNGFAETADGTLWLSDDGAESIRTMPSDRNLQQGSWPVLQMPAGPLLFDRDGALWVASANLRRWPFPHRQGAGAPVQQEIETLSLEHGLSGSSVNDVFEDREGNIWVGTEGGLDRLRYRNVSWSPLRSVAAQISLLTGNHGDVWAMSVVPPYLTRVQDGTPVSEFDDLITSGYRDPDGTIWFSASDSFWRWKNRTFSAVRPPPEVQVRKVPFKVMSMTTDGAGGLWVSVNGLGEFHMKNQVWHFLVVFQDRPDLTATAALTDAAGRIWLLYRETIALLDHGRIRTFSIAEGLDIGPLLAISQDADGRRIWVGGESGLAFLDGDRFRTVHVAGGRRLAPVTGIVLPAKDGAWLSAGAGIVHVMETELQRAVRQPTHGVQYELFDLVSDLPEALQRRHNGIPFGSVVQDANGVLWFGSARGVVRVERERIRRNQLPPPLVIRSVVADDVRYSTHATAVLPALTRNVRVDYAALSLSIPERVHFRYRLDGWDTEWHEVGPERSAIYTRLRPGAYTFRVTACNNDGVWNESGTTFAFRIAPAWFQTAWFYGLILGLLASLSWVVYRFRVRQVAAALTARFDERMAERTRIARELHDTLLQTIQGSKMVADHALDHAADDGYMRQALQQLARWLAIAVQEGRAALDSLRNPAVGANDLAEALRRVTYASAEAACMEATFTARGDYIEMHPLVRDEIYQIGYEAIRNACQHSRASQISVELTCAGDVTLRVRDNGIGIEPATLVGGKPGHFGLQGMRERATRIGATLTLVSAPASGTELALVVTATRVFSSPSIHNP
jgi:signal transduction histidine kinase/ligand-binding sensor domain-containing protein